MDSIIKACIDLEKKYGHLPFDQGLPYLQNGWWEIGIKHGITGPDVVKKYLEWKSKQPK